MKSTKDITNILNTLSYIEQSIELRRITQNIKNINTINKIKDIVVIMENY